MPTKKALTTKKEHVKHHDDSVWAKGTMVAGQPGGYWEWYRTDGTRMRSGYFKDGKQVGEWTTFDKKGGDYKVTNMSQC
jgi:antitoxin component YwqK of YwqJK toxin-antitoxin module